MALELILWSILAGVGGIAFFAALIYKVQFIFVLACILLAVSGMAIFAYDGLIVDKQIVPNDTTGWEYENIIVDSSNLAMSALALILIAIPIVSFLVFDFNPRTARIPKVFHY